MKPYILIITFVLLLQSAILAQDADRNAAPWSLTKCIDYAIANNITIKNAKLNTDAAEINYEQSKSERLPNLNASVGRSLINGTSIDPITSNYVSQQIQSGNGSISSQLTLYGGNQINNQIKQRRLLIEQNTLYEEEAKNNITLNVTEAYMMALFYSSGITIAKDNLALSTQQIDQINAKYNAGSLTARDVAEAESQKASYNYNLIVAQNSFTQQVLVIKQLLELEPDTPFAIDTNTVISDNTSQLPSKQQMYNEALSYMPEIRAAQMQIDITNTGLALSKAGYRPTLSMSSRLYTGYTNTRNIEFARQLSSNFNQQVGVNLSIPIFDRRLTWSRVGNAKVNIERAKITYTTAQKDLYRKIETAWLNASAKQSETQAALAQNEAAKVAFALAQQQFELGLINPTDLRIIQNTLQNSQQRYIQSKFQFALYGSLIQFYQGGLNK